MHILPLTAKEVEERLKKIPTGIKEEIIDQEYKPDSTNALSGIAVAEAINDLKGELESLLPESQQHKITDLSGILTPEQYPNAPAVKSAIEAATATDTTMSMAGRAADAKAVGEMLSEMCAVQLITWEDED